MKMEFELKKVKVFEPMSEETPCFTAEIWENDKHVADVKNEGRGGCNSVYPTKGFTYKDVEKYMASDVDCDIMGMADEIALVKRLQSKHFVFKKDDKTYTSKLPMPITKLKKARNFDTWLEKEKTNFIKDGYELLNTNL